MNSAATAIILVTASLIRFGLYQIGLINWSSWSIQSSRSNPIQISEVLDPLHPNPIQSNPIQIPSNPITSLGIFPTARQRRLHQKHQVISRTRLSASFSTIDVLSNLVIMSLLFRMVPVASTYL